MRDGDTILIDGIWQSAASGETLPVVDPSTGEVFSALARGSAQDIDRAIRAARRAADGLDWGGRPAVQRGRVLTRLSELIRRHFDELWQIESRDTGKPVLQAKADIAACARYFEFYGGAADKHHGATLPFQSGFTVFTLKEPYGVTGHIIPWNYPAQVFGRTIGGALAAGNACVLKPAEDACQSVLRLAALALEAGLPPGALSVVTGLGPEPGAALAAHPGVDKVSFTGSAATGGAVQTAAASSNTPVTMELGGKSPQIVFADADLSDAMPAVINAIVQNAGQTCSAGSRLIVQDEIAETVIAALVERVAALRTGPADRDLDCGPLISARQRDRVDGFLRQARTDGLPMLAEGRVVDDAPAGGYYVAPTVIGDVPPDHPIAQEEVFGPVLAVHRFTDEADALRIANATPYGLVAGVWTRDGGRQLRLARRVRAGQIFVNNYGAGGGVELPFGGVRRSGFGREKGMEALDHFTATKTVAVRHG